MSSNQQAHNELVALTERFNVFLGKLSARAEELFKETRASAQEVYEADESKFHLFKMGIEGQFQSIIQKAEEIFEQQIETPYDSNDWGDDDDCEECYDELSSEFEDWKDAINDMCYKVFKKVEEKDPEIEFTQIMNEYEATKSDFHCSQCGSQLVIDQVYFLATYIPCVHCSTQNTFVPSTRMSRLEHLSRDIAEARCKALKKEYKAYLKGDEVYLDYALTLYLIYRRGVLIELNKIVPSLAKENEEIYFREMNDKFEDDEVDFEDDMALYHNIIMRMDSFQFGPGLKKVDKYLEKGDFSQAEEARQLWAWNMEFNSRNMQRISFPNCEFAEEMQKITQDMITNVIIPYSRVIEFAKQGRAEEAKQLSDQLFEIAQNGVTKVNAASDRFCEINNI